MSTIPITVTTRVTLPTDIFHLYEDVAERKGHTVEDELAERLTKYAAVPSEKPLVFSDTQRQAIERALSANFNTSGDLVGAIERLVTISVAGTEVRLSSKLADRLATRALGVPLNKFVESTIIRLLEEHVGLR